MMKTPARPVLALLVTLGLLLGLHAEPPTSTNVPLLVGAQTLTTAQKVQGRDNLALIPSSAGKTIYVSKSTTATDTRTGLSAYDPAVPFATIAAAKTAAASGDTVMVGPGTWNERNLLKTGVNLQGTRATHLIFSGSNNGGIFDDSSLGANGAVVSCITGFGTISWTGTGNGGDIGDLPTGVINITNASSDVEIECQRIVEAQDMTDYSYPWRVAVFQSAGKLRIRADKVTATNYAGIFWRDGDCKIDADVDAPYADGTAVWASAVTGEAGELRVTGNIRATGSAGRAVVCEGDTDAKVIVGGGDIIAHSSGVATSGPKLYALNVWKLQEQDSAGDSPTDGAWCASVTSSGRLWLSCQKMSGSMLYMAGGSAWVHCLSWDDDRGNTKPIHTLLAGTAYINIPDSPCVTSAGMYIGSGGAVVHYTGRIDTSAVSATRPITKAGSVLALYPGTVLISHSSKEGIYSAAAQDVINYGYVTKYAKHANITLKVLTSETVSTDLQ